jgi:hypothetical protein
MNSIGRIGSRLITQRCLQRNTVSGCLQNTRQKSKWTETWIVGENPQAPLNMPIRVFEMTALISSIVFFQWLFRSIAYRGEDDCKVNLPRSFKYVPGLEKWEDHKVGETPIVLHHRNNPPA